MSCSSIKEILLADIYGQLARFIEEHKSDLYKMDIRSYFGSTSQASSDAKADSDSEDHGTDSSDPESSPSPPPSKKRVARIKDTTVLYPRRENTRRAGRRISVGCTMMRIAKEPFARSASNLEFLVFSVLEGLGHKTLQKLEESC